MRSLSSPFKSISILLLALIFSMGFSSGYPDVVTDFKLKNTDGKIISLSSYPDARGFIIIFTCNHCPFAKQYPERLNALNNKYKSVGIPLIAICSTDTIAYAEDVFTKMTEKAKREKFNFPYLCDGDQQVGKSFAAQKTPHAFVIWKEKGKWKVKYNGAIDDNGSEPDKVQQHYVANAVDELLNGKVVSIKQTQSIGCQIHYRK